MEVLNLLNIKKDLKGGYRFAGNPEAIFEGFFGTSNPFAQLIDSDGS
jgi:DnaJ family protein B protein 13